MAYSSNLFDRLEEGMAKDEDKLPRGLVFFLGFAFGLIAGWVQHLVWLAR